MSRGQDCWEAGRWVGGGRDLTAFHDDVRFFQRRESGGDLLAVGRWRRRLLGKVIAFRPVGDRATAKVGSLPTNDPAPPPSKDVADRCQNNFEPSPFGLAMLPLAERHRHFLDASTFPPRLEQAFRVCEGAFAFKCAGLDE